MEELNKGYEFTKAPIAELELLRALKAEIEKQDPVGEVSAGTFVHWSNDCVPACGTNLFAAPGGSPLSFTCGTDVEKLKADREIARDIMSCILKESDNLIAENQSLKAELAKATSELEAARKDAESWRSYKKRKDEVIAAGMGRNVLREAAIEQAKSCNELHEKGSAE